MRTLHITSRFASLTQIACAFTLLATPVLMTRPAVAADRPLPSMVVHYGDLNLANPSAVATLYGRIRTAAATVCGRVPDARELGRHQRWAACRNEATANAVAASGIPALVAVHSGKPIPESTARLTSMAQTAK